jgi:hypothetical protein
MVCINLPALLPRCQIAGNRPLPANRIAALPAIITRYGFAPDKTPNGCNINCRVAELTKCRIAGNADCQQTWVARVADGIQTSGATVWEEPMLGPPTVRVSFQPAVFACGVGVDHSGPPGACSAAAMVCINLPALLPRCRVANLLTTNHYQQIVLPHCQQLRIRAR